METLFTELGFEYLYFINGIGLFYFTFSFQDSILVDYCCVLLPLVDANYVNEFQLTNQRTVKAIFCLSSILIEIAIRNLIVLVNTLMFHF